jgi:hypothetical protein
MRSLRILAGALLIAGSVSTAFAHEPPGEVLFCFQFPAFAVPAMDGDLSDWDVMDPAIYDISMENGWIVEAARGDAGNDLADFNARSMWAWNEETNRVFSMAAVIDDNLHNQRDDPTLFNWDDDWEYMFDADHSGGDMYNSDWTTLETDEEKRALFYTTGRCWEIHIPPIDGYYAFTLIEGTDWLTTGNSLPFPEFVEIGWSRVGETGGPGSYVYEIKLTPWEVWSWDGPAASTIVDLEEGGIIHVGSLSKDYDENPGRYDGSYDFPRVHDVWRNANLMADMELLPVDDTLFPTAVAEDSWGRIKTHFLTD